MAQAEASPGTSCVPLSAKHPMDAIPKATEQELERLQKHCLMKGAHALAKSLWIMQAHNPQPKALHFLTAADVAR